MVTCAIASCKNTSVKISKKDGITFHRFPRDKDRKKQWETAVKRDRNWVSTSSSTVCSDHFDANDFYQTESGLRKLCIFAVPSINISPCQVPSPTICQVDPDDIKPSDTDEVVELKQKVRRLECLAEARKIRINRLWQSKKQLKKRLAHMKTMVHHLIKIKDCEEKIDCDVT